MKISLVKRLVLVFVIICMHTQGMDKAKSSSHSKKDIEISLSDGEISLKKWQAAQSISLCKYHEDCLIGIVPSFPHVSKEKMELFRQALGINPGATFKQYIDSLPLQKKSLLITVAGELQAPLLTAQLVEACLPKDVWAVIRSYVGGEFDIKNHFINQMVVRATKSPYKKCKKKPTCFSSEDSHKIVKPIPIGYDVKSKIVFSKDRQYAAAYSDKHIHLSTVDDKKSVEFSQGISLEHAGTIQGICFNPQSTLLLSWASKHSHLDIKIWDMSGKHLNTIDLGLKAKMGQVMFNHNGTRLLVRAEHTNFAFMNENDLFVYDIAKALDMRVIVGVFNGSFHDAVYSALGDVWMIPTRKKRLMLFIHNNSDGCSSHKYKNKLDRETGGKVFSLCSPDGRFFIAVIPQLYGYITRIWNAVTGEFITAVQCPENIQCASNVQKLVVTPDSKELLYEVDICCEYYETGRTFHKWRYYQQPLCCSADIPILDNLINCMTFAELLIFRRLLYAYNSGETVHFYQQEPSYKILCMLRNKKYIGELIKKYICWNIINNNTSKKRSFFRKKLKK